MDANKNDYDKNKARQFIVAWTPFDFLSTESEMMEFIERIHPDIIACSRSTDSPTISSYYP